MDNKSLLLRERTTRRPFTVDCGEQKDWDRYGEDSFEWCNRFQQVEGKKGLIRLGLISKENRKRMQDGMSLTLLKLAIGRQTTPLYRSPPTEQSQARG